MAISSVARQATVREDRSFRDAMQIIGRQQALSGRYDYQQQRIDQAAVKEKNAETARQFKALNDINSPYSPYLAQFSAREDDVETSLLNPELSTEEKSAKLSNLAQFSKQTGVVKSAIIKSTADRVGTEEQKKFRNPEGVAAAQANYLNDENGDPMDPIDFDEQKMNEATDNDIISYNQAPIVEGFMNQQKETVATETSSKNLATGFSRNEIVEQAGRLLVLNEAGTGYEPDPETGKPTVNITGETLEAFEAYSKGNELAIDQYLGQPGNEGKTRRDGMEDVLRKNGWLTTRDTREVKFQATPKPTKPTTPTGRETNLANAKDRVRLFIDDMAEGGNNLLGQLKTGRAVVSQDGEGNVTGVKPIPEGEGEGKRFTIVMDPLRMKDVPLVVDINGVQTEIPMLTTKEGKFLVATIDVEDSNPLPGMVELSALWDKTVSTKFEINPVDFIEQWKAAQQPGKPASQALPAQVPKPVKPQDIIGTDIRPRKKPVAAPEEDDPFGGVLLN